MKSKKKFIYKLHIKSYSIGLLLLSSISLLSFGFSTWYSGVASSKNVNVNVTIGETNEYNFLTLNDSMDMFEFCEYGIIDRINEMITSTGDIYAYFSLDVTNLKQTLKTYYAISDLTKFYISTSLSHSYSINNFFGNYLISEKLGMSTTEEITCNIDPVVDPTISSYTYSAKFVCNLENDNIEKLYFKTRYSFDFKNDFNSKVYSQLKTHDALVLNFKVGVEL